MPNIATVLKEEISRLARKEIRNETAILKKGSAQHRRDIAALKRQVSTLQKKVSVLEKQVLKNNPVKTVLDTEDKNLAYLKLSYDLTVRSYDAIILPSHNYIRIAMQTVK